MRIAARLARNASPSDPPIMKDVFTTPDARPESSGPTSLIAAMSTGLNAMPAPRPTQQHAGQHVGHQRAMHGRAREQQETGRREQQTDEQRRANPEAHDDLRREPERERGHDEIRRQERKADLQRRIAEHELHVERGQEKPREHRGRPEHADDIATATLRNRNNESGISGARTRDSIMRNATSNATATPSMPRRLHRFPAGLVAVHDRVNASMIDAVTVIGPAMSRLRLAPSR